MRERVNSPQGMTPGVTIEPRPADWNRLILGGSSRSTQSRQWSRRFREQLGLPVDRPVVIAGHQPEFWHPGILAKYFAAQTAARKFGASAAWVVVDQDANEPAFVRFPVIRAPRTDTSGVTSISTRVWDASGGAAPDASMDIPACSVRSFEPAPPPGLQQGESLPPFVAAGLKRIDGALREHRQATSAAHQVSAAAADLARELAPPLPLVFATSLCGTDLFAWLMDRMRADPRACALAYNAAVSEFAEAGIAPLKVDDADGIVELPLWHIRTAPEKIGGVIVREGPRRRIFAADLAALDVTELAPRALLMTAMLRLAGCDLFIHGTGGGGYDRITDLWIQAWLGFTLAPVAVVTATLLLPLGSSPVSVDEIDRAAWLAHRARHDPALLGDDRAAQQKADLVAQIRARKGARTDRGLLFARLRALLEAQRTAHADRIAKFDRDAAAAGESRADAAIRAERTWAFPLYPEPELARLKQSIENAFAGAG